MDLKPFYLLYVDLKNVLMIYLISPAFCSMNSNEYIFYVTYKLYLAILLYAFVHIFVFGMSSEIIFESQITGINSKHVRLK